MCFLLDWHDDDESNNTKALHDWLSERRLSLAATRQDPRQEVEPRRLMTFKSVVTPGVSAAAAEGKKLQYW